MNASDLRCRQPFTTPVPCPLRTSVDRVLDTSSLTDGQHVAQAVVWDAAGNQQRSVPWHITTVGGTVTAVGEAMPNGIGATRLVRLDLHPSGKPRARSALLPFRRSIRLEGSLRSATGTPITGAKVQISQRVDRPNSPATPLETVTTDGRGRFVFLARSGASRSVQASYTAYSSDAAPVSTAEIALRVRAGISFEIKPRRVRNGKAVVFSGRLLGTPGRGSVVVTIYALSSSGRKRIPVESVRTNSSGRYRYRYRFGQISGPTRYRFQARVVRQAGYPYAAGASSVVAVIGRP